MPTLSNSPRRAHTRQGRCASNGVRDERASMIERGSRLARTWDETVAAKRNAYLERLRGRALTLLKLRAGVRDGARSPFALDEIGTIAHKLAGSARLFGFEPVGVAAAALERSIKERGANRGPPGRVETDLDALVDRIERAQAGGKNARKPENPRLERVAALRQE